LEKSSPPDHTDDPTGTVAGARAAALATANGARAVLDASLARIAEKDDKLGAWVSVDRTRAEGTAARRDISTAAGAPPGPLHGVPLGLKDLIQLAEQSNAFGSKAWPRTPAAQDAPVVRRLEAAGAVVIGTTQLVEFAFGSWGTNAVMGTPRNPRDLRCHRVPGGSSSGSAVAVAGGMVPAAIGSDTGGSVRIPAALCGVVGFKPPVGAVPMEGVLPLSPTLDTLGPLTRTVADAATLHATMAGLPTPPAGLAAPDLAGARIALVAPEQWGEVASNVEAAVFRAAVRLREHGLVVEEVALPETLARYQALNGTIMAAEAYGHLRDIVEDPGTAMDENVRRRILAGRDIGAAALAEARRARERAIAAFRRDYRDHAAFLLPTTPDTASPLAEVDEDRIPMSRLTRFANYLDLAALSLPFGQCREGLPIGVQLAAFGPVTHKLFAIAARLEATA